MAQTVDEFFSSPGQVSARRTSRILEILKDAAPDYNNVAPSGSGISHTIEGFTDEHGRVLRDWAESRDMRSVVNIGPGRADKIIDSGKFYTPHDKIAGASYTGKGTVTEARLREMRAVVETRIGLPYYDSAIQDDPVKGLRPVSGENLPKSFFDVQPNIMKQIHGQDVPIMHPYAYGSALMDREVGFAGFARPEGGRSGGRYDRLILRSETAGRSSITAGDSLSNSNPLIPLSDISTPEKSVFLFGTSSPEAISDATKVGAEDIMNWSVDPSDFRKYETMTLGVGMEDIEAIISHPEHIDAASMPENLQKLSKANTINGSSYDFGKMLHQSEQRIKASQYGIDYVHGVFDDVEFHNPHMTKSFMEMNKYKDLFEGTGITPSAGETPFEVYAKAIRHNLQAGNRTLGLAGITDADRPFAIDQIDQHLEAYNKHKSFKFGATTDAVEKINFGKMSDINTRAIPLARSMANTERLASKIAKQREALAKSYSPEMVEEIIREQFGPKEILTKQGFRGEELGAKVSQYGDSMENTAARVANRQVPQTVEEGVEVAVRSSGATRGLLEASTEASSHVASGTGGSRMLRTAGAALSILRKRF